MGSLSLYVAALTLVGQLVSGVEIGRLPTLQHQVSGVLHVLDARTLRITNFNYDGLGPGAFLYYYRPGETINRNGEGEIIPLPSSVGQTGGRYPGSFLRRRFTNEELTVTMPEGTDVCDIGTLTIWCQPFRAFFTRIVIPRDIFVNSGEGVCTLLDGDSPTVPTPPNFNCISLHETLQLSWRVINATSQVNFRLCGCQSLKAGTNQYLGFGLSGSRTETSMFGADPTIAWIDSSTGEANAVDYHLSAYTQCRAGVGACPDTVDSSGTCSNDVTDVTGFVRNGQQCILFTRPFTTTDSTCDIPFDPTNENQYIVWGIGGLGETAFKHFVRAGRDTSPINLGRTPAVDECMDVPLVCKNCDPFEKQCIVAREDTEFRAKIGPSGSERGYQAITGQVGWGIAWYINDMMIPELVVERGKTYTFLVEGGDNPSQPDLYHPFYITDSINGGRLENTREVQNSETVYAGFNDNGDVTATGPLCEYMETPQSSVILQQCMDLETYTSSLESRGTCNSAQAGSLVWTPDSGTPDIVYYQCATHLNLGWRIRVLDEGEEYDCGGMVTRYSVLLVALLASIATSFYFIL